MSEVSNSSEESSPNFASDAFGGVVAHDAPNEFGTQDPSNNDPASYLVSGTDPSIAASYKQLAKRAKSARYGLLEPQYVIIDTETTGLNPQNDRLIEIAAAIMDGPDIVDTFQTFVNPGKKISTFVTDLTSITNDDVKDAPDPQTAVSMLDEFVGDRICLAHNAKFDRTYLAKDAPKNSVLSSQNNWIDTLSLSRIALPRLVSHDQSTLCDAFGIERGNHRAQGDVEALCQLWRIMLAALDDMPHELLSAIAQIAPEKEWPLRDIICAVAAEGMNMRFSMHLLRDRMITSEISASEQIHDPDLHSIDLKPVSKMQVENAFSADGIVGKMYSKFESRPEQIEFAFNVSDAFGTSTHRVIEAGTGVGKSISYLLPSAMFALANNVRVGVATKTNTLLDQLVYKELPLLQKAVEEQTSQHLTYISLKGYDHYPCLRKVMKFAKEASEETPTFDIEQLAMVMTSIAQSAWGDLDALSVSLTRTARSQIVCSSQECLHNKCSYYPKRCLLHGARKRASNAQIIVTNHALMFRDIANANTILPPVRYWVVDEAHGAEDEARKQLSYSVDATDIKILLRKLGSSAGVVQTMAHKATGLDGGTTLIGIAAKTKREIPPLEETVELFFEAVHALEDLEGGSAANKSGKSNKPKNPYTTSEIWINSKRRSTKQWQRVLETGELVLRQLDDLARSCRHLLSISEEFKELSELGAELSSDINIMSDMLECISLMLDGTNKAYCYYVRISNNKNKHNEELNVSLVDVGNELSDRFFAEENSVILTSATIAVGESFDYFSHRMGLDKIDRELWSSIKLNPSEGFYDHMQTLIVNDLPDPRSSGYQEDLAEFLLDVHLGLGGGVLTLFTNRRQMQDIYSQLSPTLKQSGIELLCQATNKSTRMLKDQFIQNEAACLFATRSFWEGFDAPGPTLKCVVIPRLPFPRPTDPLYLERSERSKDAWKTYVLPQTIIDTKQAAGRLIRSKFDSGYLIMCDSRLTSMWYGKLFLKSLPQNNAKTTCACTIRAILENSEI